MAGIQLGGLASGMDTEGIIAQLMQLEAQPGIRMAQQRKVSEAREQALRDILLRVKNLQTAAADLKAVTTWTDTQTVESSDPTKLTATRIAGAAPGIYSVSVSQLASGDQWSFGYTAPTADTSFVVSTSTGDQTINVVAGQTLDQTVGIINSDVNSKVYAVNVGGRLVLSSRETGAAASFTVSPVSSTDVLSDAQQLRTAVDAIYSLDGGATTKTSASNVVKDGIAGIEFTLKALIPNGSPVNIVVGNPSIDHTAVKDKVKKFVEQYNSTIDLIRSKLSEQKVKDPKTDADRAKGNLHNDSMLNGLLMRLRSTVGAAFDTGDSNLDQLAEIGVSTGASTGVAATADAIAGKLILDEAKLSKALSDAPLTVQKLLAGTPEIEGFGTRLHSLLTPVTATDGDFDQRVKSADREQKRFSDRIAELDKRIEAKAKLLRAQFAAMEAAINRSQSQQAWLAGQLQ